MTNPPRMSVSGIPVHLLDKRDALTTIVEHWRGKGPTPLGVASINLDHVHHFGAAGASSLLRDSGHLDWLDLIDGAPIAAAARRLTGSAWPRLAGSDLIGPLLDQAELDGIRVGFLGGTDETRTLLLEVLARERPGLVIAGAWSPSRYEINDEDAARMLAAQVRAASVDVLVVGLGKPRQEIWIERWAPETGARVLLAFGAVVDFLAGRVSRAPEWISRAGFEWAWRLALEPRRLARRYLGQGPSAYLASRSAIMLPRLHGPVPTKVRGAVIIPAHDEASVIERTLSGLAPLLRQPGVEVIVVCNGSSDGTADRARRFPGVQVVEIDEASKPGALNEGDRIATTWPRIYLDADIETTAAAVAEVLGALAGVDDELEAARPSARYDSAGASAPVRAYYRARVRIPSFRTALWGAGAYAVTERGHRRFADFPADLADDLFIDGLFPAGTRAVIPTDPVIVRTPRNLPSLLRILRRGLRVGAANGEVTSSRTARELVRTIRGPRTAADAIAYATIVVWARRGPGARREERWGRDDSSR
jgi:exopolysaccharide biosynthesis WecB/TagA/CpsF family protein